MKGLPYFCWYPADAEMDDNFREMDFAGKGFYLCCLNYAWVNGGIPKDPDKRARALRTTRAQADRLWKQVEPCFMEDPDKPSMLINERLEMERDKAKLRHLRGEKGAKAKHAKALLKQRLRSATEEAEARAYDSDYDSSEEKLKEEKLIDRRGFESWRIDELFVNFHDSYVATSAPSTEADWDKCWRFEWKKLDFQQKTDATAYLKQCDAAFLKYPHNYLRDREWARAARPTPRSKTEQLLDSL